LLPTHTVWDRGRVWAEADWTEAWIILSQIKNLHKARMKDEVMGVGSGGQGAVLHPLGFSNMVQM